VLARRRSVSCHGLKVLKVGGGDQIPQHDHRQAWGREWDVRKGENFGLHIFPACERVTKIASSSQAVKARNSTGFKKSEIRRGGERAKNWGAN